MTHTFAAAMVVLSASGCLGGAPPGRPRPAAGHGGTARESFDPKTASQALEKWRAEPPWDGWEALLRSSVEAGELPRLLDERFSSPAFREVLDACNLHGKRPEQCEAALGKADELTQENAQLSMLLVERRFGWPVVCSWRGSIAVFDLDGLVLPPVDARVLAVDNDRKLLMLSAGRSRGVKAGWRFVVHRADRYIGKVEVKKLFKDMCSARIMADWTREEIRENDGATTR